MTEKMKFIVEYQKEEVSFSELCRQYGISRPTGYKWVRRFEEECVDGLKARPRVARRHPNQTPPDVVEHLLATRRAHMTWGPRKVVAFLRRHHPEVAVPAPSTVGAILKRHGLVGARRRRCGGVARPGGPLTQPGVPNEVWCADFKGQFRLAGQRRPYCYPLTITDLHSRYLLRCQGLSSTRHVQAYPVFLAAFREYGLPQVIRTDNGWPFASRAPGGLSRLGVWWLRLGIRPERIVPGHPEQNGSHERMHRTLKAEATSPRERTLTGQQRHLATWTREFNELRPHEALGMLTPSDCYTTSSRCYPRRLAQPDYDSGFRTTRVQPQGHASLRNRTLYVGHNLAGFRVGCRQVDDTIHAVYFFDYLIGKVDLRTPGRLRPR